MWIDGFRISIFDFVELIRATAMLAIVQSMIHKIMDWTQSMIHKIMDWTVANMAVALINWQSYKVLDINTYLAIYKGY